ncbi:hypothetical protein XENTR_v10010878 [Xenopus tropicalis]|nr:hypothetical protein XENTR_v10010878 [Xenopus tropicalis]
MSLCTNILGETPTEKAPPAVPAPPSEAPGVSNSQTPVTPPAAPPFPITATPPAVYVTPYTQPPPTISISPSAIVQPVALFFQHLL